MTGSVVKKSDVLDNLDGSMFKYLIVCSRWNKTVNEALVNGVFETLVQVYKVPTEQISLVTVPGSFELPFACQRYLDDPESDYDVCIAIGTLIKGQTMHFEYIADAVSNQLMAAQMKLKKPIIFGVLTCLTEEQAMERAGLGSKEGSRGHNHGLDWAAAAVEMAILNCQPQVAHAHFASKGRAGTGPQQIENFKVIEGPEAKYRIKF